MRSLSALLLSATLVACSTTPVGPDYHVPADAIVDRPGAAAPFAATASSASYSMEPLPDHWWRLYQDPTLDALVGRALERNTDLRQALAHLEKAQAMEDEVDGRRRPVVTVEGGPAFGHPSGVSEIAPGYKPPSSWEYGISAGLSYQVDAFGRIRRMIEAAHADGEAAQAALDLVRVDVAAGTARAYADACASGLRLESARHSVALQQQALDVSTRLQQAGRVGITDSARARSQLQQLQAALPPLQASRQAALYRLATLTGDLPRDFPRDVAECARPPQVTGAIPVGDGAALLRRRPDVRRAERQLAAATADIGIATADLYPRITLGLSGGSASLGNDLLGRDSFSWSIGPLISWTIPDNGVAQARIAQARAEARAAYARFDGTVLTALREAETALDAYAHELDRHAALEAARDEGTQVADQA
ncbi:MAG TPA: efflux transporter outer membrane subunit, partial [Burkholderiaceae bacterium]|nr:efflux transporter outer membrane subunit [Burkholderiaceae bacterium]